MITFVDTNILLDIFLPDPEFGESSSNALEMAFNEGSLITNDIVYAELVPQFDDKNLLDVSLHKLSIRIIPLNQEIAYAAGLAWKNYRKAGGKRNRILTDFIIGAHVQVHGERLLTRDRGFYKKYFKQLMIIEPSMMR